MIRKNARSKFLTNNEGSIYREKMRQSETLKKYGSFFLQGRARTGYKYLLYLLRDMVEQKDLLLQMIA